MSLRSLRQFAVAVFFVSCCVLRIAHAAEIHLSWNANPETDLAGYKVYGRDLGTGSNSVFNVGLVTDASFAVEAGHSYAFSVTAYNLAGLESMPSTAVEFNSPAETLSVSWDRSIYAASGYRLSYGILNQPAQQFSAGLQTSAALTGLQRGSNYFFYVEAFDSLGRTVDAWRQTTVALPLDAPLPAVHVARVNLAPQVSLSSPLNGATYTAPAVVRLTATATDADGGIKSVDFYAGATRLGTRTTAPFTLDWSGVAAGVYQISAVAIDTLGASTRSAVNSITVKAPVPAAPLSLAAMPTDTSVTLTWSHSGTDETGFRVFRLIGGVFTLVSTLPANSVEYRDAGLVPGSNYSYRVTAYNASGDSVPSEVSTVTLASTTLASPQQVSATVAGTNIVISWSTSAGALGYNVERATSSSGPFATIGRPGVTQWTDGNVQPGVTYFYRVSATANQLVSAPSASVSAMLQSAPVAPTSLAASGGRSQIALTWRDVSNNEVSFRVERSIDGISFSSVTTLAANSTAFVDTSVVARRKYYYRVAAVNGAGNSYSGVVSARSR